MSSNHTSLGRKGLWYYVRLIIHAPIWYLYPDPEKKPWDELKGSLIKHKCQPDRGRIVARWWNGTTYRFWPCGHYGCDSLHPIDEVNCDATKNSTARIGM